MKEYEYRDNLGNPRDYYSIINDATKMCEEIEELETELQQKENIIKEVREKIRYWQQDYMGTYISTDELDELLEIVDKENK